jgi:hypothetical protein
MASVLPLVRTYLTPKVVRWYSKKPVKTGLATGITAKQQKSKIKFALYLGLKLYL